MRFSAIRLICSYWNSSRSAAKKEFDPFYDIAVTKPGSTSDKILKLQYVNRSFWREAIANSYADVLVLCVKKKYNFLNNTGTTPLHYETLQQMACRDLLAVDDTNVSKHFWEK